MGKNKIKFMELTPATVALTLCSVFCVTLNLYYFRPPEKLTNGHEISKSGPYGAPNAEFDWCEKNYLSFDWCAEPWNTFTSLLFCV